MAVSKTARNGIREICAASDVPWTDKKIDERIRAFRADARDAEPNVSPEDLAEIITFRSERSSLLSMGHRMWRGWLGNSTRWACDSAQNAFDGRQRC